MTRYQLKVGVVVYMGYAALKLFATPFVTTFQMDEDEYDMVLDSGTGRLGRGKATLYESTKKVSTMKPNLVFEASGFSP